LRDAAKEVISKRSAWVRGRDLLVTALVVDRNGMQEVLVQVVDEFKDVGVHRTRHADVIDE
jgi:hypothetical protein